MARKYTMHHYDNAIQILRDRLISEPWRPYKKGRNLLSEAFAFLVIVPVATVLSPILYLGAALYNLVTDSLESVLDAVLAMIITPLVGAIALPLLLGRFLIKSTLTVYQYVPKAALIGLAALFVAGTAAAFGVPFFLGAPLVVPYLTPLLTPLISNTIALAATTALILSAGATLVLSLAVATISSASAPEGYHRVDDNEGGVIPRGWGYGRHIGGKDSSQDHGPGGKSSAVSADAARKPSLGASL